MMMQYFSGIVSMQRAYSVFTSSAFYGLYLLESSLTQQLQLHAGITSCVVLCYNVWYVLVVCAVVVYQLVASVCNYWCSLCNVVFVPEHSHWYV